MKPTHQEFPHRNFQEEVDFLSEIFPSMWRAEACGGVSCGWPAPLTVLVLIDVSCVRLLQMVRPTVWDV